MPNIPEDLKDFLPGEKLWISILGFGEILAILFLALLCILDREMHFLSHKCNEEEMNEFQNIPKNLSPERIENVLKNLR